MLALLLCATLSQADADVPPVDPEIERASFVLPPGFEATLWAADPMLAKPIQMNWSPDGRLWVATSRTYPQVQPGEVGDDQVIVLEDRDRDGTADTSTVFADGLLIPTGLVPGDGGCYVANSTELLHLADDDRDGVADRRRILLSGFGTEDTHHLIHTFAWDPACRLNFAQSIYIHSHVETPYGVERLNAGGVWVFRPDRLKLDVFSYGLINQWGLAWTETGQAFATDGAGGEGINWLLPGGYYKTAANPPALLPGLNPGSPKHCGLAIVDGPTLPAEYQNAFLTCDFRGHRVCRFDVTDEAAPANIDPADPAAPTTAATAAGWRSREMPELIASDFPAFRPIDVKQGPDGAIYIADWYNPIIQHGEVDFRDPRRDKTHGRIWRVTYEDRKVDPVDYSTLPLPELLDTLASDWSYARRQARRVVSERLRTEPSQLDGLAQWVRNLDNTSPDYWRTRLQSLWIRHGLEQVDPFELDLTLRATDADVRAAALRVLADLPAEWRREAAATLRQPRVDDGRQDDPWLAVLELGVADKSGRVRLEAIRTAGAFGTAEAAAIAMRALDRPRDRWIDYAVMLTAREAADDFLPRIEAGESVFDDVSHRLFALQNCGRPAATRLLIESLANAETPPTQRAAVLTDISESATPSQLEALVRTAADAQDPLASQLLIATMRSPGVTKLSLSADVRDALLARDGLPGLQAAVLLNRVGPTENASDRISRDFPRVAASLDEPTLTELLVAIFAAKDRSLRAVTLNAVESTDRGVTTTMLESIARYAPGLVAARIVRSLQPDGEPLADVDRVVAALLASREGPASLERELAGKSIAVAAGRNLLASVRRTGQAHDSLAAVITASSGLTEVRRRYTPELLAMVRESLDAADPHRGETVYRSSELACQKCHAIGGAGGAIGPELRSLGAASPLEYIVESLLEPSARIKEGYNAVVVLTADGQLLTGVPLARTEDRLTLRDANGTEVTVAVDDIEAEKAAGSLMPAGLVDQLTDDDFVDLVAFLAALGRDEGLTVRPDPIARTAETMTAENRAAYLMRRQRYAAAASAPEQFVWTPIYSRVDGSLPVDELPLIEVANRSAAGQRGVSFVRVRFEQLTDGPSPLTIDGPHDEAWIDAEPVTESMTLPPGKHTLTVSILRSDQSGPLTIRYDADAAVLRP